MSTLDGKSLAGSGLPVGEDAHTIAINSTLNQALGVFEDLFLGALHSEYCVESVIFGAVLLNTDLEAELVLDLNAAFSVVWVS